MRLLLILVGVLLATVSANPVELEADLEEDDTALDIEDAGEDLGEILQGLFDARDPRDVEEETEEEAEEADEDSESVEEKEEEQVISPQEVARFNNYMDAIYRRMNAALRAKMMDPMTLNLNQKVKKEEKSEKTNHREVREAEDEEVEEDDEEDEDEQEVESVDRMGKLSKKKGKKGKKGSKVEKEKKGKNKGQKDKRMNKNDKKKSKLTRAERLKKKEERKKKQEDKKKNKTNKGDKREERSGKNKHGNKHNKKHSKAQKETKKNKGNGKGKGKGKHHKGNKARDGKDKEEGPAMGSLSGMATLRRDGDVQIKNAENHKVVKSTFSVGPLSLEVSKKYGSGKARTVRTARAKTAVMQGVMQLKVKEDGSAHILSVVFKKPEDVAVSGSISDNRKRSDNFVKNSVNKMRPLAAQKILKTARYVLKAPHSKKTE